MTIGWDVVVDLFISHSSRDIEVVRLVVRLLRGSLGLRATQIRCTSLDGYRLPAGAEFGSSLRTEVVEAKVLVGVISSQSFDSVYVLFELGARWGANKPLIPLLAPGTDATILRGPIAQLNAMRCDQPGSLHQLIGNIGDQLSIQPENPAAYQEDIDRIVEYARTVPTVIQGRAGSEPDEEDKPPASDLDVVLDVMNLNDYLLDHRSILSDYEDFLAPYVAVDSAATQAIVGAETSDPRWLAINALDRDLARRLTDSVTLLQSDSLFFRDSNLRELPILVNVAKFAEALIYPESGYSNERIKRNLIASEKVARALGQDVEVPDQWPASFFFLDFTRKMVFDEVVHVIEGIRSKHSLRAIVTAAAQLTGFCDQHGIETSQCSPSRLARIRGRRG
jgi:hypothetical protein